MRRHPQAGDGLIQGTITADGQHYRVLALIEAANLPGQLDGMAGVAAHARFIGDLPCVEFGFHGVVDFNCVARTGSGVENNIVEASGHVGILLKNH